MDTDSIGLVSCLIIWRLSLKEARYINMIFLISAVIMGNRVVNIKSIPTIQSVLA